MMSERFIFHFPVHHSIASTKSMHLPPPFPPKDVICLRMRPKGGPLRSYVFQLHDHLTVLHTHLICIALPGTVLVNQVFKICMEKNWGSEIRVHHEVTMIKGPEL